MTLGIGALVLAGAVAALLLAEGIMPPVITLAVSSDSVWVRMLGVIPLARIRFDDVEALRPATDEDQTGFRALTLRAVIESRHGPRYVLVRKWPAGGTLIVAPRNPEAFLRELDVKGHIRLSESA